uniref:Uncharacterized protein n=1 Tax=Parascaris equorum TaxID=6256 RepID=A0A914RVZ8_PAREQ
MMRSAKSEVHEEERGGTNRRRSTMQSHDSLATYPSFDRPGD